MRDNDFKGEFAQTLEVSTPDHPYQRKIFFIGLGNEKNNQRHHLIRIAALAGRHISKRALENVAFLLPKYFGGNACEIIALLCAAGFNQGIYNLAIRRSTPDRFQPKRVDFLTPIPIMEESIKPLQNRMMIEANACTLARDLVNTPAGELNPISFAELIAIESEKTSISCEIWDEAQLKSNNMNCILGVAQGSAIAPRFVILRYQGADHRSVMAWVGKGVTFDSGGLSMKTGEQMIDMKCDMAGAATVFTALLAIAQMKVPVNILALLPLVENMVSGNSIKLGDVLVAHNKKTIEVRNTDAEGRLILADALSFAVENQVSQIIDLATLTGSCMVALGTEIAGLMSNENPWAEKVHRAIVGAGERSWPLPMDEDFDELLESSIADISNVAGNRYAGAIVAGKFLQSFVGTTPWVHLDIAGPAFAANDSRFHAAGATGTFVRSLIELAIRYRD